ncbi:MAG: DUF4956 domain-containing protein [Oliverpabstia sp.]|nr:DUF4956 domain-containing protein [Oliverpabstia sp.]
MLNSIFHPGTFRIEMVAAAMITALILGILIAMLYKTSGVHISSFAVILAVMPLLVTVVIMIVNGNLGTSVAVLGAFGLVRFRSAPGTAREIGFIFFAMAAGLATGMGFLSLAILVTGIIGLVIFVLEKIHFGRALSKERELRITIPEDMDYTGIFDDLFQAYTKTAHLERVKTTNMGTMYELSYRVEMRNMEKEKEFIDELRCRNGNLTIILGLVQREKNEL